jgi:hypothetical protein
MNFVAPFGAVCSQMWDLWQSDFKN